MWLTERLRHSSVAKQVSSAGQRDVASEGLVPLCRHVGCKEARLANRGSQVCLQGPFKGCCLLVPSQHRSEISPGVCEGQNGPHA